MRELLSLNKYFKKYKLRLGLGILFVTIANVFAVLPPVVIRSVLDLMYNNINSYKLLEGTSLKSEYAKNVMFIVMINGLLLLVFAIARGIFMFFMRQTIIVMSRHIEYDQKNEIYEKYQKLDTNFFKTNTTGDLMSRISEDVGRVRMFTGPAIMYTLNLIVLTILSVWGMLRVSPTLTAYTFFFLPLLAISMILINRRINLKSSRIQAQLGKLTALAQEAFSGIRVIKSYVQESQVQSNFEKASKNYRKSNIELSKIEALYTPLMGVFIGLSLIVTVFIGGKMVIAGSITVGNIAEFIIYTSMLTFPVSTLGWTSSMIQRAAVSQKRINDFLNIETVSSNALPAHTLEGNVEFENITFTYPHTGIKAIKNLNLSIKSGQKIAVIGKTGSGKSTIAHLLLGMYEPNSGKLKIDGLELSQWNKTDFRNQIGYVPQEVFLFSDTIANNISFGMQKEASIADMKAAAQAAYIDREIVNLQDQYETIVGERGVMLSGGQKQRVSIARALVKPHRMLILDDCISAVDNTTEQHILNNLKQNLDNQTVIIITHRLFKNWDFDQILVMDDGQVIEQGSHQDLMNLKGYYYEMYQYQMSE